MNIKEQNLMFYYPILCFYTDVHCFLCERALVCRTLNIFQTRASSFFAGVFTILSKIYSGKKTPLLGLI